MARTLHPAASRRGAGVGVAMGRIGWGVLVAAALTACGGSGGGGGVAGPPGEQPACPAGQVREAGQCVVACSTGATCGGVCCAAGEACLAGNRCGLPGTSVACGAGQPPCGDGAICKGGSCLASDPACIWQPPPGEFAPRVAWKWTGAATPAAALPDFKDVLSTLVVVPLQRTVSDAFAAPAVVFAASSGREGAGAAVTAVLRAVSGRDGAELWTSDPTHPVNGLAAIAAGDLDGDGFTDFVAARMPAFTAGATGPEVVPSTEGLLAFDHQGRFLWDRPLPTSMIGRGRVYWGAPSVANLYGGGEAQVVLGATVLDARGNVVCEGTAGQGDNFLGPISTVADVDLDGVPEIVTGNTVYRNDCTPMAGWPAQLAGFVAPDGLVAVADFVGDAHPEIVTVSGGRVRVTDWQGRLLFGPVELPHDPARTLRGGGAPTIADFDGDGRPEIGVAGDSRYAVFKPFRADGTPNPAPLLWARPTQDESAVTGSSVFDFQNDGKAEVVYGDECYTRVFDGASGGTLFEAENASCTVHENPVIADVDRDGRAEIVVGTNSVCDKVCTRPDGTTWRHVGSGMRGVSVFKDLRDRWVATRPVWNQHAYHVTNVGEDGTLPVKESPHWRDPATNAFRANPMGAANYAAPDLAAEAARDLSVVVARCPAELGISVRVWNRGATLVAPGVPVAVYAGAAGAAPPVALGRTVGGIVPGESETLVLNVPAPAGARDFTVVLNDDGTGEGVVGECDRANNAVVLAGARCPAVSQ